MAKQNGGALFIRNIRKMKITGETSIVQSYAFGSGGGINYECNAFDVDTCLLELGAIHIENNTAKENGGGIYWPNTKPIFNNTFVQFNSAGLYGHNFASYPIQLVRL